MSAPNTNRPVVVTGTAPPGVVPDLFDGPVVVPSLHNVN
ncbi:hypothetical protein J2S53_000883 [Actinopolyspora lacussalsi]|nr:hypothetical protein [Actinopolyspora lacussalsi]